MIIPLQSNKTHCHQVAHAAAEAEEVADSFAEVVVVAGRLVEEVVADTLVEGVVLDTPAREIRKVRTGITDLDNVEVVSGLDEGDSVLVLPSAHLLETQQDLQKFIL